MSKKSAAPAHPPYAEMIRDAIVTLKERGGSSLPAIKKCIVGKHKLPEGWEKKLSLHLKKMTAEGKLTKVKASWKLGDMLKSQPKAKKPSASKKTAAAKPATAKKLKKPKAKKPKKAGVTKKAAAGAKSKAPAKPKVKGHVKKAAPKKAAKKKTGAKKSAAKK